MDLIEAHVRWTRAAGLSENTTRARLELLRRVDNDLPMGLERATVEELADWLAQPGRAKYGPGVWSVQTRATYFNHLRSFFAWACDPHNPVIDYDPSAALPRPRVPKGVPRPVTDDEVTYALTVATNPWRLFIVFAAYAGLRAAEIATVRREDITEDSIRITGKGRKTRIVSTHQQVWGCVRDFPRGRLAQKLTGGDPTGDYISTHTGRYLRDIGLVEATLHRFRHWYGTSLLAHGANLRVVQELMGHASPATTAIYTLVTSEQRRQAVAALPDLAPTPS